MANKIVKVTSLKQGDAAFIHGHWRIVTAVELRSNGTLVDVYLHGGDIVLLDSDTRVQLV